jgi:hypothetical protein
MRASGRAASALQAQTELPKRVSGIMSRPFGDAFDRPDRMEILKKALLVLLEEEECGLHVIQITFLRPFAGR